MIDLPILNVVDGDDPADTLTFVITQQPQHGKIVRQTRDGSFPITNFTLDDISGASTIEYEHDDTETVADLFKFYLLDGQHNVSRDVPIKVFPVDDETPRLTVNNGLELDKAGETKVRIIAMTMMMMVMMVVVVVEMIVVVSRDVPIKVYPVV